MLSSKAGTFTLPGGSVASVESGGYDSNDDTWVRAASKPYSPSSGQVLVNLNAGECIRVVYGGGGDPGGSEPVSGATYKIRNSSTGTYLDSDAAGAVVVAWGSTHDDQDWVAAKTASGDWTIRNVRSGRFYLTSTTNNNAVIWNSGAVNADSLWTLEPVTSGSSASTASRTAVSTCSPRAAR